MIVAPRLVSYSGVVGSGEAFLLKKLQPQLDENKFTRSVSTTTRTPRDGEEEGKAYYFTDKPAFEAQVAQSAFLEYNQNKSNGAYYGTTKAAVSEPLDQGKTVLRNADVEGAKAAKAVLGEQAVNVFILPPPFLNVRQQLKTLNERLEKRNPDMPGAEKQARLAEAKQEIINFYNHASPFDYLVLNAHGNLQSTLANLKELSYKGQAVPSSQKHVYPYGASPLVNAINHIKQFWWDLTHNTRVQPTS